MFKVIVAGSRGFCDYRLMAKKLDYLLSSKSHDEIIVVSGGARGADSLGERYAREHKLKLKVFPADWDTFGKRAGYLRNKQMAEYADALVAFWDGQSRGTQHMIELARQYGLAVRIVLF